MFHRRSACFTLHDRLERIHVVDVHRQSDAIGIIRLNERADGELERVALRDAYGSRRPPPFGGETETRYLVRMSLYVFIAPCVTRTGA